MLIADDNMHTNFLFSFNDNESSVTNIAHSICDHRKLNS